MSCCAARQFCSLRRARRPELALILARRSVSYWFFSRSSSSSKFSIPASTDCLRHRGLPHATWISGKSFRHRASAVFRTDHRPAGCSGARRQVSRLIAAQILRQLSELAPIVQQCPPHDSLGQGLRLCSLRWGQRPPSGRRRGSSGRSLAIARQSPGRRQDLLLASRQDGVILPAPL
jgi:hypothetical protein